MLFSQIIPPLPLPQSPKDCSIHLCLFCCLAYRVVVTTFLNSRAFNLIVEVKALVAQPCPTLQFTATLWTIAHQAPLFMEFSRQECWNGFPFPSPEDLPNPAWIMGSYTVWATEKPIKYSFFYGIYCCWSKIYVFLILKKCTLCGINLSFL